MQLGAPLQLCLGLLIAVGFLVGQELSSYSVQGSGTVPTSPALEADSNAWTTNEALIHFLSA